jgi:hypothetical protein
MKQLILLIRYVFFMAALIVVYSSCNDKGAGKIPFNEERARQQIIPVQQGSQYSVKFVNLRDSVLPKQLRDSSFLNRQFNLPIAETFNRDAIIALLNAEGADGVRIYFGNDDKGLVRLVLMPVDKNGNDIVTKLTGTVNNKEGTPAAKAAALAAGESVENGQRPPPPPSALNP